MIGFQCHFSRDFLFFWSWLPLSVTVWFQNRWSVGFLKIFSFSPFSNFPISCFILFKAGKVLPAFLPLFPGLHNFDMVPIHYEEASDPMAAHDKSSPDVCLGLECSTPLVCRFKSYFFGEEKPWRLNGLLLVGRTGPTRYAQSLSC